MAKHAAVSRGPKRSEPKTSDPKRRERKGRGKQGRYGNSKKNSWGFLRLIRDLLVIVVLASVLTYGLKTFVVRPFYIPSGSMMQTLQVQDKILVNQLPIAKNNISHGDIIVFKDPGGWVYPTANNDLSLGQKLLGIIGFAPDSSEEYVIKRVIGLPGDTVACCDANGLVTINGVPIKEPYINLPDGVENVSDLAFEVTVPENSFWVLGDNRYSSKDSRYNQDQPGQGFVPMSDVVGKAFMINWPLNRITMLDGHSDVFVAVEMARTDETDKAQEDETP